MLTKIGYATAYCLVFTVRAEMGVFLHELGAERGWTLLAELLRIRFASALEAYLDAPTARTLAVVVTFRSEMEHVGRSAPGYRR